MKPATPSRRRTAWELAAFASPSTPILALSLPSLIFLAPYFNTHLGIGLSTVTAIFLIARVADILVDPSIGNFQDRSTPRMGRRRFWIAVSTPALMIFVYLIFIGIQPGVPAWLVSGLVLLMYWAYASLAIAHLSWAGELQPDYHGRTRTLGAVQIAGMIGYVGMLLVPAVVVQGGFGGPVEAVKAMGVAGLITLPLTAAWCVLGVREDPSPPQPHSSLREMLGALRTNTSLRRVLLPDFLIGAGYGVTGALFVFVARYYLGFEKEAETLLLVYFLSGLFAIPLWVWAGRKFGKHNALIFGCLHAGLALACLPFIPKGDFAIGLAAFAFAGFSQSAGTMLLRSMMADVVDEDTVIGTGGQRSGLFFGLLLTTSKVGLALGPITYAVLDQFGFEASLGAANSPAAMNALIFQFAGVPVLLNLLTCLTLLKYPLDAKRQAELAAIITERNAAQERAGA